MLAVNGAPAAPVLTSRLGNINPQSKFMIIIVSRVIWLWRAAGNRRQGQRGDGEADEMTTKGRIWGTGRVDVMRTMQIRLEYNEVVTWRGVGDAGARVA
jgi:hypothetical protein